MTSSLFDYLFKLIIIGDSGVGKSCLVDQFINKRITHDHDITVGVQFAAKTIQKEKKVIKLQIWDTAGQQNFRSITRAYYRNAVGALLVYDITRRESFNHVKNWIDQVKNNGNPTLQILLVGNKCDKHQNRKVTFQQGLQIAIHNSIKFIETTAKDYKTVEQAFQLLVDSIIIKIKTEQIACDVPGLKMSQECKIKVVNSTKTCC